MAALFRISDAEREYIRGGVEEGVRADGRRAFDYRPFTLETSLLPQANGSARIRLANTDILIAIKAEIGEPDGEEREWGKVIPSVELMPSAAPDFFDDEGERVSQEMTRLLKSMFTPQLFDLSQLKIIPGKQCWILYIDCVINDYGGNLGDTLSIGVLAALQTTRLPAIRVVAGDKAGELEIEVSDDPMDTVPVECGRVPIAVSFTKIGTKYIIDSTVEEELCMRTRLTYGINRKGNICAILKAGPGCLQAPSLVELLTFASGFAKVVFQQMDKRLEDEQRNRTSSSEAVGFYAI